MAVVAASASTTALLNSSTLISQGAEAKVYRSSLHTGSVPILLKHRFAKQYRHPTLDSTLTRSRVVGEARALLRCLRCGVSVPGVRFVDQASGILGIEWIEGRTIRFLLGSGDEGDGAHDGDSEEDDHDVDSLADYEVSKDELMNMVGTEIAKMHLADIIHGDLTTSNMMLSHPSSLNHSLRIQKLVLIDFGLAYTSILVEDKAVDLYVLERAFASTHPASEPLFASVLDAYKRKMGKDWTAIGRRLEDGK
ncbi:kinase-like domain-containing protein [Multifurca ochricompacta]|uniref:non-specific serine/threonine protein kinase n=1 Tax=Multifurca ochricompacta TaxID=376703 RepID=A0AAD4LWI4_9AGAM|nr:kinase-like domain-containing protein [Multifurca ochricompacta]